MTKNSKKIVVFWSLYLIWNSFIYHSVNFSFYLSTFILNVKCYFCGKISLKTEKEENLNEWTESWQISWNIVMVGQFPFFFYLSILIQFSKWKRTCNGWQFKQLCFFFKYMENCMKGFPLNLHNKIIMYKLIKKKILKILVNSFGMMKNLFWRNLESSANIFFLIITFN